MAFSLVSSLMLKKQAGVRGVVGPRGLLRHDERQRHLGIRPRRQHRRPRAPAQLLRHLAALAGRGPALPDRRSSSSSTWPRRRKMESERLHPFSKPQAVARHGHAWSLARIGGIWDIGAELRPARDRGPLRPGVRRPHAHDDGHAHPGRVLQGPLEGREAGSAEALAVGRPGHQPALPRGRSVAHRPGHRHDRLEPAPRPRSHDLPARSGKGSRWPSPTACLVVAYFGLAHPVLPAPVRQARGQLPRASSSSSTWVVPLLVGTITLFANSTTPGPAQIIFALSPIVGLGLSAGLRQRTRFRWPSQAAAITPSLLFAFVFNGLVTAARRRRPEGGPDGGGERRGCGEPGADGRRSRLSESLGSLALPFPATAQRQSPLRVNPAQKMGWRGACGFGCGSPGRERTRRCGSNRWIKVSWAWRRASSLGRPRSHRLA